jgi:hypothetical protein
VLECHITPDPYAKGEQDDSQRQESKQNKAFIKCNRGQKFFIVMFEGDKH